MSTKIEEQNGVKIMTNPPAEIQQKQNELTDKMQIINNNYITIQNQIPSQEEINKMKSRIKKLEKQKSNSNTEDSDE